MRALLNLDFYSLRNEEKPKAEEEENKITEGKCFIP